MNKYKIWTEVHDTLYEYVRFVRRSQTLNHAIGITIVIKGVKADSGGSTRIRFFPLETMKFRDKNVQLGVLFHSIDDIWSGGFKSFLRVNVARSLTKDYVEILGSSRS